MAEINHNSQLLFSLVWIVIVFYCHTGVWQPIQMFREWPNLPVTSSYLVHQLALFAEKHNNTSSLFLFCSPFPRHESQKDVLSRYQLSAFSILIDVDFILFHFYLYLYSYITFYYLFICFGLISNIHCCEDSRLRKLQ